MIAVPCAVFAILMTAFFYNGGVNTFREGQTAMQKQAVVMSSQFIVSGERIEIRPLPETGVFEGYQLDGRFPTLLELEQEYVQKVLAHVAGNKSRAAEVLGIDRVSLWRKLKRFAGMTDAGPRFEGCPDRL